MGTPLGCPHSLNSQTSAPLGGSTCRWGRQADLWAGKVLLGAWGKMVFPGVEGCCWLPGQAQGPVHSPGKPPDNTPDAHPVPLSWGGGCQLCMKARDAAPLPRSGCLGGFGPGGGGSSAPGGWGLSSRLASIVTSGPGLGQSPSRAVLGRSFGGWGGQARERCGLGGSGPAPHFLDRWKSGALISPPVSWACSLLFLECCGDKLAASVCAQ